ncbi:MAG: hypothetical protein IJ449_13090 [Clostridia bacterium]|nr:hypothetical protein [Clostridia bacterium]
MKQNGIQLLPYLLLTAALLASCQGEDDIGTAGETTAPAVSSAAEAATDSALYTADYLPDADYEGYVFRCVTVEDYPVAMEKEDGDVVNDAYYKRNAILEERYNIDFEDTYVDTYMDMTDTFRTSALAASNDFDLCRLIMRDAFSMALEGYILPVSELPYLDITQDWYIHYVNEELTINDTLIFAYSDECISAFESTYAVIFNKQIIGDLGLDSPYDMVDNGTWTYDALFEMAQEAISDLDNDGKYTLETDRFGIISVHDQILPCTWVSSGIKTVEKQDGIPVFTAASNERLITLLGKVYDYWAADGMCYDAFLSVGYDEANRRAANLMYAQDHALFMFNGFGSLSILRDMEHDFGLVPLPKYDETQKEYYSRLIDGWINVPLYCTENPERTSVIMEALAVETKNYVIPALYEDAIQNKYLRDETSVRMLDLVMQNRSIDLGDTVWMVDIRNIFMDCFRNKKPDFASAIEKNTKKASRAIDKALESLGNQAGN